MSALDERQLQEIASQEFELNKLRAEAKKLKPMPIVVSPPEGYYISGADYNKYKSQAREYNKNLSQYKRDLNQAYKDVIANRTSLRDYERLSRSYIAALKQQAPQRLEYRQQVQELALTGPPEPTLQQRQRSEAGIPQTGLPGPSQARPGSISAQLQPIASEALQLSEKPFELVTDPLRTADRYLEKLSHDAHRTNLALQLDPGYGTKREFSIEQAVMVESKPRPAFGTGAYLGSVGIGVVATGIDVATFGFRPGLWVKTAGSVIGLAVDPETQLAVATTIVKDPFRFTSTIIGGPIIGVKLASFGRTVIKEIEIVSKALKAEIAPALRESPQGMFVETGLTTKGTSFTIGSDVVKMEGGLLKLELVSGKIPRVEFPSLKRLFKTARAVVGRRGVSVDSLLDIERGLYDFPSEVIDPEFLQTFGPETTYERTWVTPTSQKSFLYKKGSLFKPKVGVLGEMGEQILVPTPVIKPVTKWTLKKIPLNIPSGSPRIPAIFTVPSSIPDFSVSLADILAGTSLSITDLLSVNQFTALDQKMKETAKEMVVSKVTLKTLLKPITIQESGAIQIPRLTGFQTTVPVSTQVPKIGQTQKPVSITTLLQTPISITTQIQTPIQKPISVQIPRITFTPFVFPKITKPKPPIRFRIPKKKKKKKKKTDKRKKKGVYELRVDKIVKGLLKL